MKSSQSFQKKFARALNNQLNPMYKKKLGIILIVIIIVLFIAVVVLNRFQNPLLMMPKMMASILIGMAMTYLINLKNMRYLEKYVDKEKLKSDACE